MGEVEGRCTTGPVVGAEEAKGSAGDVLTSLSAARVKANLARNSAELRTRIADFKTKHQFSVICNSKSAL